MPLDYSILDEIDYVYPDSGHIIVTLREDVSANVRFALYGILNQIQDQYQAIAHWLFWNELIKGYYTQEDSALGKNCFDGITICNNELNEICGKVATDKVQSEILSILFHR